MCRSCAEFEASPGRRVHRCQMTPEKMELANITRQKNRKVRRAVATTLAQSEDIPEPLRKPLYRGAMDCSPVQLQSYLASVSDFPGVASTMNRGFDVTAPADKLLPAEQAEFYGDDPITLHYSASDMPGQHMATLSDVRYTNSTFDKGIADVVKEDRLFRNFEMESRRLKVEEALAKDPDAMDAAFGPMPEPDDMSEDAQETRRAREAFLADLELRKEMEQEGVYRWFSTSKSDQLSPQERQWTEEYMSTISPQEWERASSSADAIERYSTTAVARHLDPETTPRQVQVSPTRPITAALGDADEVQIAEGITLRRRDSSTTPLEMEVQVDPHKPGTITIPVTPNMMMQPTQNVVDRIPYVTGLAKTTDSSRAYRSGMGQMLERTLNENSPGAKANREAIAGNMLRQLSGTETTTRSFKGRYSESGRMVIAGTERSVSRGAHAAMLASSTQHLDGATRSGLASDWSMAMTHESARANYKWASGVATNQGFQGMSANLATRKRGSVGADRVRQAVASAEPVQSFQSGPPSPGFENVSRPQMERMVASLNAGLAHNAERDTTRYTESEHTGMVPLNARVSVESLEAANSLSGAATIQRAGQMSAINADPSALKNMQQRSVFYASPDAFNGATEIGSQVRLSHAVLADTEEPETRAPASVRYVMQSYSGVSNGSTSMVHLPGRDTFTVLRRDIDNDGIETVYLASDDALVAGFTEDVS